MGKTTDHKVMVSFRVPKSVLQRWEVAGGGVPRAQLAAWMEANAPKYVHEELAASDARQAVKDGEEAI